MVDGPDDGALEVSRVVEALQSLGPLVSFPWHRQQANALSADTDVVTILGGSRSGKTTVAAGIVARLVRREGPIYRRLRNADRRPLRIWVAPQLTEKFKSNWEDRLLREVFAGIACRYTQSPHPVFEWDDGCAAGNQLWAKSQEQGFLAFESDEVDLVVFDEEPADRRLYHSAQQRLATTNGVIVFAFTPLMGLSWTHGAFYLPTVKPQYQVADRVWRRGRHLTVIGMGMADNPAAREGGGVDRIQADPGMSEAEKQTRLFGKYGFAEGLIFPECAGLSVDRDDSPYLLDELPSGRPYSWVFTCDPNKRHGGLLTAIDHEGNQYVVAEHYAEGFPDRLHAERYRAILARWSLEATSGQVSFHADPGGAGAQAIVNLADVGIYCQPVRKDAGSVKASIDLIRRALYRDPHHRHPLTGSPGAPRVYLLRSLRSTWKQDGLEMHESRLMWELRQYRQKENAPPDTPVKEKDDLTDCLRYLELVRPIPASVPVGESAEMEARKKLDALSRTAAEEYDELVRRVLRPRRNIAVF